MFDELDAGSVVAEIVMLRAAENKAVLIVEGSSDERAIGQFVDDDHCDLVIARGKQRALEALEILRSRKVAGVVCLLDRDYDDFLGRCHKAADVIVTEHHDLESMMMQSEAFDRLLDEMGSKEKVKKLKGEGLDPRELVARAAFPIGVVRLYSAERDHCLKFVGLRFRFLDKKTLAVDIKKLVSDVLALSRKSDVSAAEVEGYVVAWGSKELDPWQICCGHDLSVVLGTALRTLFGTHNAGAVMPTEIERRLRLAFSADAFRKTNIFQEMRGWEATNHPYRCLRAGV